jgi:hypothetical protein
MTFLFSLLAVHAADTQLSIFNGTGFMNTRPFDAKGPWEVQWESEGDLEIKASKTGGAIDELIGSQKGAGKGASFQPNPGNYYLKINGQGKWQVKIVGIGTASDTASTSSSNSVPTPKMEAKSGAHKLTNEQRSAVVIIEGNKSVGTGFICKMPDGLAVITNQHVLSGNDKVRILTLNKQEIPTEGLSGAIGHDLAMYRLKEGVPYSFLEFEPNVDTTVKNGDEIIAIGNSQGGGVLLETPGMVQGIGPNRLEVTNPIFSGNSGGPIMHAKTGKVIGVITFALEVDKSDFISKNSLENSSSAIKADIRYFGLRLDSAPKWESIDWERYVNEARFLADFETSSRQLASLFQKGGIVYKENSKLREITDTYVAGMTRPKMNQSHYLAVGEEFVTALEFYAQRDFETIGNSQSFQYDFHKTKATQQAELRQFLIDHIGQMKKNVALAEKILNR